MRGRNDIKATRIMKEPVIDLKDIKTKVRLEDKFDFTANITIGLAEGGDFYLVLKFTDLTLEKIQTLSQLVKLTHRLSIKSDVIDREKYNITHIVVTKFSANSYMEMTWECLSDDPSLYEGLS
jgi:hypothetical protein